MTDPITTILAAIATIAAIVSALTDIATHRRTTKQHKPYTPVSTTILTIDQNRGPDLPTYDPGMKRMGFDRFNRNNR
jgi:hypothetical protein